MEKITKALRSRREFIQLAIRHAVISTPALSLLSGHLQASEASQTDRARRLSLLIKDILPHPGFPQHLYSDIGKAMEKDLLASADLREKTEAGFQRLQALQQGRPWSSLTEKQRLEILESIQGDGFFRYLRDQAITRLYQNPQVWELIGYGGSAIEHGGYVHRGFNDIDWLPREDTE